jgi:hypothetical protein
MQSNGKSRGQSVRRDQMKISLYIAATLSLASLGALAQSNRTNVELNGRRIALRTVQPMQAGRDKLIPLRPLIARMGGRIQWERDTNTIVVSTKNERSARIYPGKNFVQATCADVLSKAAQS